MYDVFAIGNVLIDALIKVDDSHLIDLNLKKGSMNLVDEKTSEEILKRFEGHEVIFAPAGDVVNTLMGVANLGGNSILCGKVGLDKHGAIVEEAMIEDGVKPILVKGEIGTGSCVVLVTPDYERTMATNLGASVTLSEEELIVDDISKSKVVYLTGYTLEDPLIRQTSLKALEEAKKHKKTIAIDVADQNLIQRCNKEIKNILNEYANIVFANEEEVYSLTGKKREEGLKELGKYADIAVVKIGKEGVLIMENENIYKVPGFKVKEVDTTGAGDLFAAGFLYGYTNGRTIKQSGIIGNYVASRIVQQMGARLDYSLKEEVKKLVK